MGIELVFLISFGGFGIFLLVMLLCGDKDSDLKHKRALKHGIYSNRAVKKYKRFR